VREIFGNFGGSRQSNRLIFQSIFKKGDRPNLDSGRYVNLEHSNLKKTRLFPFNEPSSTANMADINDSQPTAKPAAKKEKPPAVEDKPFEVFIPEHFMPSLDAALKKNGINDMSLDFVEATLPIKGLGLDKCWQIQGSWKTGDRQFNIYFLDRTIGGQKAFSFTTNGTTPSTLESFMIDERKVTLDLLVLYVLQRLNGQKWLALN
jgi:hypothetical protein